VPLELDADLQSVFREVFNQPTLTITREMKAADVSGWDSLKHIELIVAVESRFKVKFRTAEIGRLKNIGDLIDRLGEKLKKGLS
jgi:acyl carrier protein